jgi:DNA polymerase-3 subunit beta
LLEAAGGRLSLAATDMEISLRVGVAAEAADGGSVVVPGRLLVDIVRLLPAAKVEIEHGAAEGVVHLRSGTAAYTLHTYSAEDFPRLPEIDRHAMFSVEREAFLDTIRRVSRAASKDESRPVLTGILVRFDAGKVVMAATDSYRLSVKETPIGAGPDGVVEAIVPARALGELQRLCQAEGPPIEIGVQENQVIFGADDVWLTARRIDGQFPNYRQLLPETFEAEVQLPRQELAEVVRRAKLMVQRNSPVRLRFEEGQLTVSAQTQDVGEVKETMPAAYAGEPIEVGFNAEFLLDGLESVTDETVRLKLISPLRPGMIHGVSDDFLYLIMPIRLAG